MKNFIKKMCSITLVIALMCGLLTTTYANSNGQVTQYYPVETQSEENGVNLKKTAVWNEETQSYEITLESFVTGEVTSETTSVPTDIVLVLDVSGSMDENIGNVDTYKQTQVSTLSNAWNKRDNLYVKIDDEYVKVSVNRLGYNNYTYTVKINDHTIASGSGRQSMPSNYTYYTKSITSISKMDSLKNAVNNFIDETYSKNLEIDDVNEQHRISIVKYSGDKKTTIGDDSYHKDRYEYNYSQIVKGLTTVNYNGANVLKGTVNALHAAGSTRSDYGLDLSETVLNSSSKDRQKVVIMFTDGEPNALNGFDEDVANNAIKNAKDLKDDNVKVYTIGLFSGANPNQSIYSANEQNRYMHAVSSNYPNATSYSVYKLGKRATGDYYKAASDAEELNSIFQEIQQDISKPSIELDSTTVLKDVLSDYFKLKTGNVTVYSVNCVAIDGDTYTWGNSNNDSDQYKVTIKDNTIDVTGFDYSENFVAYDDEEKAAQGKKLVVKFEVVPIDGFMGGNAVPTNKQTSGIYKSNTNIAKFPMPYVDVEYNYDYAVNNMKDYLSNHWNAYDKVINSDDLSKISGLNNDFVDVTFTIKQSDQEIGTYTISHDGKVSTTGQGLVLDNPNTKDLTVSVDIISINKPVEDTYDNITINTYSNTDKTAKLYILVPTTQSSDTTLFLGESIDLSQQVTQSAWQLYDQTATEPLVLTGSEPKVELTIADINGQNVANTFNSETAGQFEFKYIVKANDMDITQYTSKTHNTTICSNDCTDAHFYVTVVAGNITVTKTIDQLTTAGQGNPIFTFKLEGTTVSGKHVELYKTVRFEELKDQTITFNNLEKGIYTVTELDTMRYKLANVTVNNESNVAYKVENQQAQFAIGCNKEYVDWSNIANCTTDLSATLGKVTYSNELVKDKQLSDTDVINNTFKVNGNGTVTINQETYSN